MLEYTSNTNPTRKVFCSLRRCYKYDSVYCIQTSGQTFQRHGLRSEPAPLSSPLFLLLHRGTFHSRFFIVPLSSHTLSISFIIVNRRVPGGGGGPVVDGRHLDELLRVWASLLHCVLLNLWLVSSKLMFTELNILLN
jgi:hypothetical protein